MSDADPKGAGAATLLDQESQAGASSGQSGDDAGQKPAWVTDLPEELQSNASLNKFGDVIALSKGYLNLESLQGNSVRIPGENATAEARGEFYKKLGQPATKEGYELEIAKSLGQTDEDVDNYKDEVHSLNLTKKQAEALWKWSVTTAKNKMDLTLAGVQKKQADSIATLRRPENWGTEFDVNVALAQKVGMRFGGEDFLKLMRDTRIGDDPIMLKMLVAVGTTMSEDTLVGGVLKTEEPSAETVVMYDKSPELYEKK